MGSVLGIFRLNTKNIGEEWLQDECPRSGLWRYEAGDSESESCPKSDLLLLGAQRLVSANVRLLILLEAF